MVEIRRQEDPVSKPTTSSTVLEQVYRAEGARIWRALFLHSGDREIASDALAEAFAQALRRGDALEHPDRWVWRAAFRIAAGQLKERGHEAGELDGGAYDFPIETVLLARAISQLSPMQRGSVILHYYADRTASEAASILGSSGAAVRVHLFRARRRLAELMEAERDD
jgi:RNA polymerase sigma-70 factor (ECF subfamily)